MYLEINGVKHTCSRRIVSKDTIKYLSVTPTPEEISGTIQMYRDDGFLMSEDNVDGYGRKTYVGTCLTVTNAPEPTPIDPTTQVPYRVAMLEQENAALKEQLATTEDALCEMDSANEERLAAIEDALCELDMGGTINE